LNKTRIYSSSNHQMKDKRLPPKLVTLAAVVTSNLLKKLNLKKISKLCYLTKSVKSLTSALFLKIYW